MAQVRRERLNRERVLDAAVALANQDGIDALTMRRLAQELGVVPMALYKHFANKDQLLGAMVDRVFAEVDVPSGAGWRTAMRARALSMRAALLRNRWAVGRMETATPGPANLGHHEAVMRCLRVEARFDVPMAVHVSTVLDSYIYGAALQQQTLSDDIPQAAADRQAEVAQWDPALAEHFPHLVEVVTELGRSGYDHAGEFEFGLDLLLDGIERVARRRRS